ncbi:hypothetical protein SAMN05444344_0703 [Tenacibaculum mesophilum]|uniref:Uncharacterized protein n=1 Tax=Tenacibaculum mesophilum TaxID=104268 RepID=A0ABM7CI66_9FLAO|nr:hypothetical protein [Tenacibaculum mesophilum]AZJ33499.1 hypothetical protein D6200_13360 [Tenacibaculum mesophilum]QFS28739.1 hypothetical protein F9Y86_10170 [Tenacibaculum mesophilum]SHF59641.1 hypothetical protein SAMN05444344_0703 [Tenacibaculum mesophilum]
MEILLIIFLLLLAGLVLFLLYKILKWIAAKRVRIIVAAALLVIAIIGNTLNRLFFTKMEMIQSTVYPNLYLVKHPIKDRDSLNNIIKSKVIEVIGKNPIINQKIYSENTYEAPYATLAFYTYSKNSKLSIFQDYGTSYFIDNQEDLGGMIVEDLSMYQTQKLATYNIKAYKNDITRYYGALTYFKDAYPVKTDTINNNVLIKD